ncbi:ATP/GTP-binding protein [Prescottella equi]|uniref:ATP/GTP-binding protein n=1 Tax=Rhodococcus hoagii TaxID=43767 RepID=UPI000A7F45D2|nr:ATP/GTP-binding protein [Prescottella equi]
MAWNRSTAVVDDTIDAELAQLAADIEAGNAQEPGAFTSTRRALNAWRRRHGHPVKTARRENHGTGGPVVRFGWPTPLKLASKGRGYKGRGGGTMTTVVPLLEYQSTTMHACGLNPWVIGAASPQIGVPVGVHVETGEAACWDVLSWFTEGLISNPSAFVLSLPGLGKSTLIRKAVIGAVAYNQIPIIAADIKGEYVRATHMVNGQVVKLGHGYGHINPLASGALGKALGVLESNRELLREKGLEDEIAKTVAMIHSRQVNMCAALLELNRKDRLEDFEVSAISVALRELRETSEFSFEKPPLLGDLLAKIGEGSDGLVKAVWAEGMEQYRATVRRLCQSLVALLDGSLGHIFASHTTTELDLSYPAICIDVSGLERSDQHLKAAVMLACWSDAFGTMEAAHLLADCGLGKQRYFLAVLDELWQVLGAGAGMVNRIDELTRLNRSDGTGLLQITHTGRDLESLPSEVDVKIAKGFIERSGMVIAGGLPQGELDRLADVLPFSEAEARQITSWSRGAPLRRKKRGKRQAPLGRGKFMLKISKDEAPGIPIQTILTEIETHPDIQLHNTNIRFDELMAERGVA